MHLTGKMDFLWDKQFLGFVQFSFHKYCNFDFNSVEIAYNKYFLFNLKFNFSKSLFSTILHGINFDNFFGN